MRYIHYFVAGLVAVLFVAPLTLSAQATDSQSQIEQLLARIRALQQQLLMMQQTSSTTAATSTPAFGTHRICLIAQTLNQGETSQNVQTLQEFLREQGFFSANATGFFGAVTLDALKKWQAHNAIVSNGNAATTGWGVFGPRTRAFIARWCAALRQTTALQESSHATGTTATTTETAPPPNQPPIIASFTGPLTLVVGTVGTWVASSTDPEGGTLTYRVTWSDAGAQAALWELAGINDGVFGTATTFTHTYSRAGSYPVVLRVRDSAGATAMTTRIVQVTPAGGSSQELNLTNWLEVLNAQSVQNVPGNQNTNPQGSTGSGPSGQWTDADMIQCLVGLKASGNINNAAIENCFTPKSTDGSCWFNGIWVQSGSWVSAYEKAIVPPTPGEACKMEIRRCNNGVLSGTYKAATCSKTDLNFGNPA